MTIQDITDVLVSANERSCDFILEGYRSQDDSVSEYRLGFFRTREGFGSPYDQLLYDSTQVLQDPEARESAVAMTCAKLRELGVQITNQDLAGPIEKLLGQYLGRMEKRASSEVKLADLNWVVPGCAYVEDSTDGSRVVLVEAERKSRVVTNESSSRKPKPLEWWLEQSLPIGRRVGRLNLQPGRLGRVGLFEP